MKLTLKLKQKVVELKSVKESLRKKSIKLRVAVNKLASCFFHRNLLSPGVLDFSADVFNAAAHQLQLLVQCSHVVLAHLAAVSRVWLVIDMEENADGGVACDATTCN